MGYLMEKHTESGIEAAIRIAGSQTKLAKLVGVTQQNISVWLRQGYVPLLPAVKVEQATGVPRRKLLHPEIAVLVKAKRSSQPDVSPAI